MYKDGTDIARDLVHCPKADIIKAGFPIKFGHANTRTRNHLVGTVAQLLPMDQQRICSAAANKRQNDRCINSEQTPKRAKHTHPMLPQSQAVSVVNETEESTAQINLFANSGFLKPQSRELIEDCIANFIDRTGNSALKTAICVACTRELVDKETQVIPINAIPNHQLLVPYNSHPAHKLTDGLLLMKLAIVETPTGLQGAICKECLKNLGRNWLPRLALANDMWIGEVPFELSALTLPEQILIAQHFPAANIVKLFPAKKGVQSVNCGLCGNVPTYRLNTDEIAGMVDGKIMPNPSQILASIIGVTLISPNIFPK